MTTFEDKLFDACYELATKICADRRLRYGIERIANAMVQAALDESADIAAERDERQAEMFQA